MVPVNFDDTPNLQPGRGNGVRMTETRGQGSKKGPGNSRTSKRERKDNWHNPR